MALGLGSDFRFDIHARDRTGPAWRGVETSMQRTMRAGTAMMAALGPLLGVGGVAIGGSVLADLSRRSLEFADALVTAADRTSFTVDQLERLRFAGHQNRVEFGQTDMAMQRWSRRVAEAAQGAGELRADLERMNIPLRDSEGRMRSSYEILLDYADAVSHAESDQERLRLAFKAFDSEGAALVNVLREGREGLIEYGRAAEDAGALMGDRLAREAAAANRELREMQTVISGQFNRAVAENADDLLALANAFGSVAKSALEAAAAVGSFLERFDRTEGGGIALSPQNIGEVESEMERARAAQEMLRDLPADAMLGSVRLTQIRGAIGQEALDAEGVSIGARSRLDASEILFLTQLVQMRIDTLDAARDSLENSDLMRRYRERFGDPGSGRGDRPDPNNPLDMPDDDWGADVTPRFAGRPARDAARNEAKSEALEGFAEIAREQAALLKDAELEAFQARREAFSHEFATTFADGVVAAFDGDLEEFLRRRLYAAAYNGLYEAFTRAGEHLFDIMDNAGGGGSGAGGFLSSAASFLSNTFGGGRAAGGPMQAGMMYRVGEQGPETILAGMPATVLAGAAMAPGREMIRERVVVVKVDESEMFRSTVEEVAGPIAEQRAGQAYAGAEAQARKRAARATKRLR